jgi:polysaccharide deacetylase 2 family uncharacterized protein YibQ
VVIEYADLECPYCAKAHLILKELPITRVFRHFPVVSKHPRARVLAAAAEAAGLARRAGVALAKPIEHARQERGIDVLAQRGDVARMGVGHRDGQ